ncbi:hypothetical protein A0256_20325 [Mucilaginibacter sp. PAMC 26640]|nr:hypothetical protein A0256_20325 [Mucilaginibacter sp. PAMC 26640]
MIYTKFLTDSISAIVVGIMSSAIFLIIISRFKPKIRIGDSISCSKENTGSGNQNLFSFKVVNKSLLYYAYDIKIKLYICEQTPSLNGDDVSYIEVPLRKSEQWVLPQICWKHLWQDFFLPDKRLSSRTNYAAQFSTYHDIKTCLNQRKFITFEIIAKHSLTGFSIVKSKSYKHTGNIEQGNFLSGNTFKIK